jgi:hypothetical protein
VSCCDGCANQLASIKQANFFSVFLDYFQNTFLSLPFVDKRPIGCKFLWNFEPLQDFGNLLPSTAFENGAAESSA